MSEQRHVPVLLDRIVALVSPALQQPESVVVDATLGMGGHSEAILRACPQAHVVGLDRDPQALELAGARLASYTGRTTLVHAVYDEIRDVLTRLGIDEVQGVLFDLGVSSLQLDEADRGFAYAQDAPLDMRMDPTTGQTAAEVLNTYSAAGARPHPVAVRRGAVRPRHRAAPSSASVRRHRSTPVLVWSSSSALRSRRPLVAPAATLPSARSRPCASRSTTSSVSSSARCRPRSTPSPSEAGSS